MKINNIVDTKIDKKILTIKKKYTTIKTKFKKIIIDNKKKKIL